MSRVVRYLFFSSSSSIGSRESFSRDRSSQSMPPGLSLLSLSSLRCSSGKTLLAKAVANETSATFLRVVGSELIQKYLGDGPKLVREMFKLAHEHAPSIVFIDEIDAVGTKR